MTAENLTAQLAERVMNWGIGPDRFTMGHRRWMPRNRFRPTNRIEDAFRLLEHAEPQCYDMSKKEDGSIWVTVRIGKATGEACNTSIPLAISIAVARAIGIPIDVCE